MTSPILRHTSRDLGTRVPRITFDTLRPRPRSSSPDMSVSSSMSTFSVTATAHVLRYKSLSQPSRLSRDRGLRLALKPSPNCGLKYRAQQRTWTDITHRQHRELSLRQQADNTVGEDCGTPSRQQPWWAMLISCECFSTAGRISAASYNATVRHSR